MVTQGAEPSVRDDDAVLHFVERFALVLTDMGLQRMAARVFAMLMVTDSGRMTAAELADALSVSRAAISGAVRYLDQVGMVQKTRLPGQRVDSYSLYDDLWYTAYFKRTKALTLWQDSALEGMHLLGEDTPAGRRMAEMREFFDFIAAEIPRMYERWHETRRSAHTDST